MSSFSNTGRYNSQSTAFQGDIVDISISFANNGMYVASVIIFERTITSQTFLARYCVHVSQFFFRWLGEVQKLPLYIKGHFSFLFLYRSIKLLFHCFLERCFYFVEYSVCHFNYFCFNNFSAMERVVEIVAFKGIYSDRFLFTHPRGFELYYQLGGLSFSLHSFNTIFFNS